MCYISYGAIYRRQCSIVRTDIFRPTTRHTGRLANKPAADLHKELYVGFVVRVLNIFYLKAPFEFAVGSGPLLPVSLSFSLRMGASYRAKELSGYISFFMSLCGAESSQVQVAGGSGARRS